MKTGLDFPVIVNQQNTIRRMVWKGLTAVIMVSAMLTTSAFAFSDDSVPDDQSQLQPIVNQGGKELRFDWPMIRIGTAEYKEGPTGVTVFSFARPVLAAHDVRGEPATANTDWLRLGRDRATVSAVVLSGGSFYGLESTTAVATAMKDDHVRTGIGIAGQIHHCFSIPLPIGPGFFKRHARDQSRFVGSDEYETVIKPDAKITRWCTAQRKGERHEDDEGLVNSYGYQLGDADPWGSRSCRRKG
jgi:hypothetical protein